jgi:uncharacterized protein YcbK (DUF882 family)
MITKKEILMGRDVEYPLNENLKNNLDKLLECLNKFRELYGKPMAVSSGYRPGKYNVLVKGAKNSSHITCEACDFRDNDGKLKSFITEEILEMCDLYMEDPNYTPTWVHLSIRPTKKRIFKP